MSRGYQPGQEPSTVGYHAPQAATRRAPVWIGAVAAAVLGVVGFGVVGVAILNQQDHASIGISPPPTAVGTGNPPTSGPPGSPSAPAKNAAAARARPGDCLSITGAQNDPVVSSVPCDTPGSSLVVERFDGTADRARCATVPRSNSSYRHEDDADPRDSFVLCLHR
jgi:hypothetical protein